MAFSIPTSPDQPFYTQETTLDGVRYLLDFRYSQRARVWYLAIALADNPSEWLAGGIKIVCNYPLLRYCADVRLPRGILVALTDSTDDTPPDLGELGEGKRVTLTYVPLAEASALKGGS